MAIRDKVFIDIQTNSDKAGSKLKQFAVPAAAAGAALKMMYDAGKEMFDLFKVQEQAEAKLNATLKATAFSAGMAADELTNLASALQKQTLFGDEAIIGAESLLLTFKKIGKDIFPQVTETVLDMSAALGQDLKTSAIQVGKALNDPIRGVGALRKVGVDFTEDQEELIRVMVETNDIAGAQAVIMNELASEFGGVATALGDTATGALEQFNNAMNDGKEVGGEFIAHTMKPTVNWLTKLIESSNDGKNALMDLDVALGTIGAGGDAGDLTNEMMTQLAVVKKLEESVFSRFGAGKDMLVQAKENLQILARQQAEYNAHVTAIQDAADVEYVRKNLTDAIISNYLMMPGVAEELNRAAAEAAKLEKDRVDGEIAYLSVAKEALAVLEDEKTEREKINEQIDIFAANIAAGTGGYIKEITAALGILQQQLADLDAMDTDLLSGSKGAENPYDIKEERLKDWIEIEKESIKEYNEWKKEQDELELEKQQEIANASEELLVNSLGVASELLVSHLNAMSDAKIAAAEKDAANEVNIINAGFEKERVAKQEALADGKLSQSEYNSWLETAEETKNVAIADQEAALYELKKEEMRKQAIATRAQGIFDVAVNTAVEVSKVLANPILAAIVLGAGLVQGIAIAAAPMPAFAEGGSFLTNGPSTFGGAMVGDNVGGIERVDVTPISSSNTNGPKSGNTINLIVDNEIIYSMVTDGTANGDVFIDKRSLIN